MDRLQANIAHNQHTKNSTQSAPVTRGGLVEIRNDLKQHFIMLIKQKLDPIAQQLTALSTIIKDVATTADSALELAMTNKNKVKELCASEHQLKDRIA